MEIMMIITLWKSWISQYLVNQLYFQLLHPAYAVSAKMDSREILEIMFQTKNLY